MPDAMKTPLLPCPFCGSVNIYLDVVSNTGGNTKYMFCSACHAHGPWFKSSEPSHDKWNTRHGGWQPIATAPKDGTMIMLCIAGFNPCVGCWFNPSRLTGVVHMYVSPEIENGTWASFDPEGMFETDDELLSHLNGSSYEPTHWMPLPTPPTK